MATLERPIVGPLAVDAPTTPHRIIAGGWLQVLPHLDAKYGGVTAVVPRLAKEIAGQEQLPVRIAAFCAPEESHLAADRPGTSLWPLSRTAWTKDADLKRRFRTEVESSKGLHLHGLWESSTFVAASAARRSGVPYVLSAHGMLERWALRNKRLKKAVYAALFERENVQKAACLHALTQAEAADYRRFGAKGPVAIIPNGVEKPSHVSETAFLEAFPQARGKRLVLFLGRIHYKKGVDLLVRAWATIASEFPDTLLVMAGPDSEGTLAKVQATVAHLQIAERVLFTGMLSGPMKWSALAAGECFVLPSYSEGLSVAVLEAMSMGLPLVLSHECNLPEVERQGAGWLVQTEVEPLATALRTALSCSEDDRQRIRSSARALTLRDFSWSSVAARMAAVYRWVGGGPFPADVDFYQEAT